MSDRMSDRGRSSSPSGRPGSSRGSQSPARASSPSGSASGRPAPLGYDPGRIDNKTRTGNTRMELPADAYLPPGKKDPFPTRESYKYNTEGQTVPIEVNQYRLTKCDYNKKIYQYDLSVSPEPLKLGPVVKKLLAHQKFKEHMRPFQGQSWLWDGKKLGWSATALERGETRLNIDLDEGKAKSNGKNKFFIVIRQTTQIDLSALRSFLERKTEFNSKVGEAMNFMDHLLRMGPSTHLFPIRRSFYTPKNENVYPLGGEGLLEVRKGTYASIRLSQNLHLGGFGLGLNADVANTAFWKGGGTIASMIPKFLEICDGRFRGQGAAIANLLRPVKGAEQDVWQSSDAFKHLRKLRRLKFKLRHRVSNGEPAIYSVQDILFDNKYGGQGANARAVTFEWEGRKVSVYDYFGKRYKIWLSMPELPLIDAGKGGYIPMEAAVVEPMQRYPFKLTPDHTAAMIKIAVTRPKQRRDAIEYGVASLGLAQDRWLNHYGVQFDTKFAKTEGKLLKPPVVNFRAGSADPKYSGRWDLRGNKKFWMPNRAPLQNWGFIAMDNCVDKVQLEQFARTFKQTFVGHGGVVRGDPLVLELPGEKKRDGAEAVAWGHDKICTVTKGYTQMLFIVVPQRNSPHYIRLKKNCDIRFGILSQVVNAQAVRQNNPQYHSNVCMKVNAKLGGATSRTAPPWQPDSGQNATYFTSQRPTMIIGADVSHAAPGGTSPSVAAMTMSVDRDGVRYAALAENNGERVEIMSDTCMNYLFKELFKQWRSGHNVEAPAHIIYLRDGVAEGQFAQVLQHEIGGIKACLRELQVKSPEPKFTVIIARKRHHVRFFPASSQGADKNGNALPGTLVEKEVTHPFLLDWYMCSHSAIQGTARPVHYHVIKDDMGMPLNVLQRMLYHQCYSYARSTTPVSIHPAVYYAHLASNRARAHEQIASSAGFRAGGKGHEMTRDAVAKGVNSDNRSSMGRSLLRLGGELSKPGDKDHPSVQGEQRQRDFTRGSMWYI